VIEVWSCVCGRVFWPTLYCVASVACKPLEYLVILCSTQSILQSYTPTVHDCTKREAPISYQHSSTPAILMNVCRIPRCSAAAMINGKIQLNVKIYRPATDVLQNEVLRSSELDRGTVDNVTSQKDVDVVRSMVNRFLCRLICWPRTCQ